MLHARLRKGSANTARGMQRFVCELVARPFLPGGGARRDRAALRLGLLVQPDTLAVSRAPDVHFTMAVQRPGTRRSPRPSPGSAEEDFVSIDSTWDGGIAEVAETAPTKGGAWSFAGRAFLVGPAQMLWPDWRHFAFVTDLEGSATELDAFHRDHARVELAIRDLEGGAGHESHPLRLVLRQRRLAGAAPCSPTISLARWTALLGGVVT